MDDYSSGIDWGAVDIALPDENNHDNTGSQNKNHSMPFVQSVPQHQQQQQQHQYQQAHSRQQYQFSNTQQYQQNQPQLQQQYHHQQQHHHQQQQQQQMYKSQSQNSTVTNTNLNQLPPSSNGIVSSNEFHLQQKVSHIISFLLLLLTCILFLYETSNKIPILYYYHIHSIKKKRLKNYKISLPIKIQSYLI